MIKKPCPAFLFIILDLLVIYQCHWFNFVTNLLQWSLWLKIYHTAKDASGVDCVLSCDRESNSLCSKESEAYLNLSIVVRMISLS